jgi:hypothetical protein
MVAWLAAVTGRFRMANDNGGNRPPPNVSREELAWARGNLPRVRGWVTGQYFLREALISAFVLGLAAHIGGYLLRAAATGEPLRLLADLVATLGTTIWTGVILLFFVEVLPEARRGGAARRLAAYESALRDQGRSSQ